MQHAVPLSEVTDLHSLADDLADLLGASSNADIAEEFPSTVRRYTSGDAVEHLIDAQQQWAVGIREQFVIFSGNRAVGMAHAALTDDVPEGINPGSANFSVFICNPYRQQGLGKLSAQSCVKAINANFGGRAWTTIDKENISSQRMTESAGFVLLGETNFHDKVSSLYTYTGPSS